MKNSPLYFVLFAAVAVGSGFAKDKQEDPSPVTVTFEDSDNFTDARSSFGGGTDEHYLDMLSKHIQKAASKRLAAGQKLEVSIKDVDLAGDFLPGRASTQDVRVVKEIYIPRVKLSFKLLDADGKILKEGERFLSDLNFMMNVGIIGRNDPLFYDKELLTAWVKKEFKS
jgi:hypothetical protein